MTRRTALVIILCLAVNAAAAGVYLRPASSRDGYLARLLVNEVPFPGEKGWVSEKDTRTAMSQILWVLHSRIAYIPDGYKQQELAMVKTRDIIDVITAGGVRGQCDGFYRDSSGKPAMAARIPKRIDNLARIANQGKPGRFASLLSYAQGLSTAYIKGGMVEADKFAGIARIGSVSVTGRAYSWMQDRYRYHPGGDYVKIPDSKSGSLGGNRFSTLKERQKK